MPDTQGLTRFGRWARRNPRMGRAAMICLLPVYLVLGSAIGASRGRDEAMDDWHRDWKTIRLSAEGGTDDA